MTAAKLRVNRTMTYGGRVFQAGDAVARSWIIENGSEDKLGILQRTGFVQDTGFVGSDITRRTKAELLDKARELGINAGSGWTKADLVAAVQDEL